MKKSVKSIHPCQSVIQTIYFIVKAIDGELDLERSGTTTGTIVLTLLS